MAKDLSEAERAVLGVLVQSRAPVSGRQVARAAGVAPTTAIGHLRSLQARGAATARASGRATLWVASGNAAELMAPVRQAGTLPKQAEPLDVEAWPIGPAQRPEVNAVILTALGLEYAAVRQHLGETTVRRTRSGGRYDVAILPGKHFDWKVHLAEVGMGNVGAAAEVIAAVDAFDPRLVVFCGVAGGLKPDDQRLGDVVIADTVYNVHRAKLASSAGDSEIQSRPVSFPTSFRLTQLVRAVMRTDWWTTSPVFRTPMDPPNTFLRPIVAGEVVLADSGSDFRKLIAERFNDAAAIDMESLGMYESAHRCDVPVLAVRGLSDLVGDKSPAEDRDWQPRAALHAAIFTMALLQNIEPEDLPQGRASTDGGGPAAVTPLADADIDLNKLPPPVRPWWQRFRRRDRRSADAALRDLLDHGNGAGAWVGSVRRRPPAWLRQDVSGDAWAMLARFCDAHNSSHALWAFEEAARRMQSTGEALLASLQLLQGAITAARLGEDAAGPARLNATTGSPAHFLGQVDDPVLDPLRRVISASVSIDTDGVKQAAPTAAVLLGLADMVMPVLAPAAEVTPPEPAAQVAFHELGREDPSILVDLQVAFALFVGMAFLVDDEPSRAVQMFEVARDLAPAASGPLLALARAKMQYLSSSQSLAPDMSATLREVENLALIARDRRRDWGGETPAALALVARARAQAGDPQGALRLVLPPPRGVASAHEAADAEVREAGALVAALAGDHRLALDLLQNYPDSVERDLLRGVAAAQLPSMSDEAERSFRQALSRASDDRPDQLVRALVGLVRLGCPVAGEAGGNLADELERLQRVDPEAADLVRASAALQGGRPSEALVLARRYPQNEAAVRIAADAAVAAGDPDEAIRLLTRAANSRGYEALRTEAMVLALTSGRDQAASELASMLELSDDDTARQTALQVRLELSSRAGRWQEVVQICERLIRDDALDQTDPEREGNLTAYRWALVGARYNLRQFEQARRALDEPDRLNPRNRQDAMLMIATLSRGSREDQDRSSAPDFVKRLLSVARSYADDEEVAASALTLLMTSHPEQPLPDSLLADVRALQEEFFDRFPETPFLRRISVGDDLQELVAHIKETFEPRAQAIEEMAQKIWLGMYPLAILPDATGRNYAETLIKRPLGCYVASSVHADARSMDRDGARRALARGRVVLDTSVLVVGDAVSRPLTQLMATFARVLFPAAARDDVLASRDSLNVRSTGSLGWHSETQRPQFTEFPGEVVDAWARSGEQVAQLLEHVDILPLEDNRWSWESSIALARREAVPLWADDLPLRAAARSEGVDAFGTLDLIAELVARGVLPQPDEVDAGRRAIEAFVVDLPIDASLQQLAKDNDWEPQGYPELLIARPATWSSPQATFQRFTTLLRELPANRRTPERLEKWCGAAFTGIAWATPPAARANSVAAVLSWVVMTADAPDLLPRLVDVAERLLNRAAPGSDIVAAVATTLAEIITDAVPAERVAQTMVSVLAPLDPGRRERAMRVFLRVRQ